jgi:hypothetical protein
MRKTGEPADHKNVPDESSQVPTWWPTEQEATPRARRVIGGNGVPEVDLPRWRPPVIAPAVAASTGVATMLGDDVAKPRELLDMLDDDLSIPAGWIEEDVEPRQGPGWIEARGGGGFAWGDTIIGRIDTTDEVVAPPEPMSLAVVPGAPLDQQVVPGFFAAKIIETRVEDDDGAAHLPSTPRAPVLPTVSMAPGGFGTADALHVDDDPEHDPLSPKVAIIERIPWGLVLRGVVASAVAITVVIAGFTMWRQRAASSRGSAARSAIDSFIDGPSMRASIAYGSDRSLIRGEASAIKSPMSQRIVVDVPVDGNRLVPPVPVEVVWIGGDLYLHSRLMPGGGDGKWIVVRTASTTDMRPRVDLGQVTGAPVVDPFVALRLVNRYGTIGADGVGAEVGGRAATKYVVTLDSAELRAAQSAEVNAIASTFGWNGTVEIGVWVADGKLLQAEVPFSWKGLQSTLTLQPKHDAQVAPASAPGASVDATTITELGPALAIAIL